MKLTTYVLLMFCISAMFYLIDPDGSGSMFSTLWGGNAGNNAQNTSTIYGIFEAALLGTGALLLVGAALNFSSFFIIPFILVFAVLNALTIPTTLLVSSDTPDFVKFFTFGLFNILLLMTIYDEVRGR